MTLKVKAFEDTGAGAAKRIASAINRWLEAPTSTGITIHHTDVSTASAGPAEDRIAAVAVFVWYQEGSGQARG